MDTYQGDTTKEEGMYEYVLDHGEIVSQLCPKCKTPIGIMPGTPDAICQNCGYKDPCCE